MHRAKDQKIKGKTFSLNKKRDTLCILTGSRSKKKKNYKMNCKKILVVKPWPLEEEELLFGSARW